LVVLYLSARTPYSLPIQEEYLLILSQVINLINIEAAGGGAAGNSAINSGATNEDGSEIWQGGGGGGSEQFGSITILFQLPFSSFPSLFYHLQEP